MYSMDFQIGTSGLEVAEENFLTSSGGWVRMSEVDEVDDLTGGTGLTTGGMFG